MITIIATIAIIISGSILVLWHLDEYRAAAIRKKSSQKELAKYAADRKRFEEWLETFDKGDVT